MVGQFLVRLLLFSIFLSIRQRNEVLMIDICSLFFFLVPQGLGSEKEIISRERRDGGKESGGQRYTSAQYKICTYMYHIITLNYQYSYENVQ